MWLFSECDWFSFLFYILYFLFSYCQFIENVYIYNSILILNKIKTLLVRDIYRGLGEDNSCIFTVWRKLSHSSHFKKVTYRWECARAFKVQLAPDIVSMSLKAENREDIVVAEPASDFDVESIGHFIDSLLKLSQNTTPNFLYRIYRVCLTLWGNHSVSSFLYSYSKG